MALCGVAMASDSITLRYAITEWDGSPSNSATSPGTTSVSSDGFVNYTTIEDIAGVEKQVGNLTGNGYFKITNEAGINAGGSDILNTSSGFTLVFNGYGIADWGDYISFNVGGTQYKFETNDGTGVIIYTPDPIPTNQNNVKAVASISTKINRNTWYNFALTAKDGNYVFSTWDAEGTLIDSSSFQGASGNLVDLYEGARFSCHYNGGQIDNVGLYDGVLTNENLAALVKSEAAGNGMIQSFAIPEPATATLSLLALCGLAARRRRK